MTIHSDVKSVMTSAASYLTVSTGYRLKVSGSWGSWLTCSAEITGNTVAEEWDEERRTTVKKQRASLKVYDTPTADAPVLRIGDEVRQDNVVWAVSGKRFSAQNAGIYRYDIVRDVNIRSQPDRKHLPIAEGGAAVASTGGINTVFTATNVEVSATIFFGALVQRTSSGLVLANASISGKDAIGICTVAAAIGDDATYITEGAFRTTDWTAIAGTTLLTKGARYFQDINSGKITTTVPSSPTFLFNQMIGTAVDEYTLDLEIVEPYLI